MSSENMVTPPTPCRLYRGALNDSGYGIRKRKHRRLHRWVMAQVHGDDAIAGRIIMHLCDQPACFRYDHLRIADQSDNIKDAYAKGRKTPTCKLSEEDARAILASTGTVRAVAAQYGISHPAVVMIRQGKRWPHLQERTTT